MSSSISRQVRSGGDAPIAIDLDEYENDEEMQFGNGAAPPVATPAQTARGSDPPDVGPGYFNHGGVQQETSVLNIPAQPTGGAVWDASMIALKTRGMHDEEPTVADNNQMGAPPVSMGGGTPSSALSSSGATLGGGAAAASNSAWQIDPEDYQPAAPASPVASKMQAHAQAMTTPTATATPTRSSFSSSQHQQSRTVSPPSSPRASRQHVLASRQAIPNNQADLVAGQQMGAMPQTSSNHPPPNSAGLRLPPNPGPTGDDMSSKDDSSKPPGGGGNAGDFLAVATLVKEPQKTSVEGRSGQQQQQSSNSDNRKNSTDGSNSNNDNQQLFMFGGLMLCFFAVVIVVVVVALLLVNNPPAPAPPPPAPTATTEAPVQAPPTEQPTTEMPITSMPSDMPSLVPTTAPTLAPTTIPPSLAPSTGPSLFPTKAPSVAPSAAPSGAPTTEVPTQQPTTQPTTPAPIIVFTPQPTPQPVTTTTGTTTTVAPTLNVFPDNLALHTQIALQDPGSPQSRALNFVTTYPGYNANMPEWRKEQLFALASFYYSYNGDDWQFGSEEDWLSTAVSECMWGEQGDRATVCNDLGQVTYMALAYQAETLQGTTPPEMSLLSSLEGFEMLGNRWFTGVEQILPSEMAQMSSLADVQLKFNRMTGFLPSSLGQFVSLTNLNLRDNFFSGQIPSELGLLTNLKYLILYGNYLTGTIPTELAQMTSLEFFGAYANELSGTVPTAFCMLPTLGSLRLDCNFKVVCPPECNNCNCEDELGDTLPPRPLLPTAGLATTPRPTPAPAPGASPTPAFDASNFDPSVDDPEWPGDYPTPANSANAITINIRTDQFPGETEWEWSKQETGTDTYTVVDSRNNLLLSETLYSYDQSVDSNSVYRLTIRDTLSDGTCCVFGFGWFTITNATTSASNPQGTVVWSATGVFESDVVAHIYVDSQGRAALVELQFSVPTDAGLAAPAVTPYPTSSPASGYVLGLPEFSVAVLESGASTAQSSAYQWLESHPSLSSMTEDRKQQLFALATFYYAFTGDAWELFERENWLSYSVDECEWGDSGLQDAVVCDPITLKVTELAIESASGFSGSVMPPEMSLLPSLESLKMDFLEDLSADFADLLPTQLAQLTSLHTLFVYETAVFGSIPTNIMLLTSLSNLNLRANDMTGTLPSELGLLTNLQYLTFYDNIGMTGTVPSELGQLTELQSLLIDRTQIGGSIPEEVCSLPNLQNIRVDCALVVDCPSYCLPCSCYDET